MRVEHHKHIQIIIGMMLNEYSIIKRNFFDDMKWRVLRTPFPRFKRRAPSFIWEEDYMMTETHLFCIVIQLFVAFAACVI